MRLPLLLLALAASALPAQRPEAIWYIRNDTAQINDFAAHARQIDIIAPQVFSIDSMGTLRGSLHPRIIEIARANRVKVHALVINPGFDPASLHRILVNPDARAQALRSLGAICRTPGVDGVQLDLENFPVSDKDAFTSFARAATDTVHKAGCPLSAAVVPRADDDRGTTPYHNWLYDYWRGSYDYKALADTLDFISYMTYAQHTGSSTPGPVAGYDWMRRALDYVLKQGVPPNKISLGIPSYSDWWYSAYDGRGGARAAARDIEYTVIMAKARERGVTPTWDARQHAWTAIWDRNDVYEHAWIEDARAFKDKLGFVPQYRLRGYSVWLIGFEDPAVWGVVAPPRR